MQSTSIKVSWRVICFVFIPFMSAYLLSELYRNINSVVGPILRVELEIGAAELGFLTSVFLAAIAGSQIFVGILLDRYGPRKVVASLMVIAAGGAVLFASSNFAELVVGRFLIGLGMAACWTGAYKANAMWFPPERLALANAGTLGLAGLGALAATLPTELILAHLHWQTVFMGLAAAALVLAASIWMLVPDHESERTITKATPMGEIRGLGEVLRNSVFWKVGPISFLCQGVWLAYQGLWSGVWMREVDGLAAVPTASNLMALATAIVVGQLVFGLIADQLSRRGISLWTTMSVTTTLFVGVQAVILVTPGSFAGPLWSAYGLFTAGPIFAYALISLAVPPHLSGRAISLLNLFSVLSGFILQYTVGIIIELWPPNPDGLYPVVAHQTALGILLFMQVAALLWMLLPYRERQRQNV